MSDEAKWSPVGCAELIASLERQLAEARRERDEVVNANETIAVCPHHTTELTRMSGLANGCWVCECDQTQAENDALAAQLREADVVITWIPSVIRDDEGRSAIRDEITAWREKTKEAKWREHEN